MRYLFMFIHTFQTQFFRYVEAELASEVMLLRLKTLVWPSSDVVSKCEPSFATAMSSTAAECPEQSARTFPPRTSTSRTRPSSVAARRTSRPPPPPASPGHDSRVIPLPTRMECRETCDERSQTLMIPSSDPVMRRFCSAGEKSSASSVDEESSSLSPSACSRSLLLLQSKAAMFLPVLTLSTLARPSTPPVARMAPPSDLAAMQATAPECAEAASATDRSTSPVLRSKTRREPSP